MRYSPDKIFKLKVTTAKAKSRSHHDTANLHPQTNVPTKYQLFPPQAHKDTHLDAMGENNTLAALKGCGVKSQKHKICDLMTPV